jgi:hypothetical protein
LEALTGFMVLRSHLTVIRLVALFERSSRPYSRRLRELGVRTLEEAFESRGGRVYVF